MRANSAVSRTVLAAATLSGLASAIDANAKTNVATYWGQGPNQSSLQTVCANPNIDIVNIAFVNVFPDQGAAGWPGTDFGNACGSQTYTYNGTSTQLLSKCSDIGPDIEICQKIYNTKVFLSIGGGYPTNYYIDSDASAANFAKFLWGAFGPSETEWTSYGGPRPFGDAVVDGFDFDIESSLDAAPVVNGETISDYKTRGYATMIHTFKNTLFPEDTSKTYYISGAPQCVVPDAHLSTVVAAAHFDFLFVQYYNTPRCSARQAISSGSGFTGYQNWQSVDSYNKDVKLYMGLPGSTDGGNSPTFYLTPAEVQTLVGEIYSDSRFGGIMLWEATYAAENIICSRDYATWMKEILVAAAAGTTVNTKTSPCPAQPVSKDGTCGTYNGKTCVGSIFGSCCSSLGYCGDSSEYCSTSSCDSNGGNCGSQYIVNVTSTSSSTVATATGNSTSFSTSKSTSVSASSTAAYGAGVGLRFASSSTSATVSASAAAFYGSGAHFANSTNGGTATYPKVTGAPFANSSFFGNASSGAHFANSSLNAAGAVGAAAGNADALPITIFETSTIYGTVTKTITYSASQGGDPTIIVTEYVTQYTTVYPIATQTPAAAAASQSAVATQTPAAHFVSASAAASSVFPTTIYKTSTVYGTVTKTVTYSASAGGDPTTIVTEILTQYTTVYPVATQTVTASATSSSVSDSKTDPNAGAVKNVKVTKTIYSTEYFTVTSSGAASGPSTVTLTSTYAISTTVISYVQEADPTTSATTTITLHSTTTDTTTVMATSSVRIANNAGPFSFSNASSVAYGFANSTVTSLITATVSPVAATSASASYGFGVNAANAVAGSGAAANATAGVETLTIESVVPVTTVIGGAAAASGGVAASGSFVAKAAFQSFSPKQANVVKNSGDQARVDVGVVVLALFIGAFFAL
ncbi:hypothetical protein MBLNU459_g2434t2 [Dothideomycetes sp. NU459]